MDLSGPDKVRFGLLDGVANFHSMNTGNIADYQFNCSLLFERVIIFFFFFSSSNWDYKSGEKAAAFKVRNIYRNINKRKKLLFLPSLLLNNTGIEKR